MWKPKLSLFVVILFVLPLLIETIASRKCWKYSQIGGVQIIAGPEEMWVFLQVDDKVTRSCILCENPQRKIGHSQQLLVIDEKGVNEKKPISFERGGSFDPRFSTVFESEGHVYLYDDFSTSHDSVYRWTDHDFERLSSDESATLLEGIRRDEHGQLDWKRYFRKSDWKQLAESYILGGDSFKWNDRTYTLEAEPVDKGKDSRVMVHCSGEGQDWSEEIARISYEREPISPSEFESLVQKWRKQTQPKN